MGKTGPIDPSAALGAERSDSFRTIQGQSIAEIVEKKSRFICRLQHVSTEQEALDVLQAVRSEHAQARHNVYAYIVRATPRAAQADAPRADAPQAGAADAPADSNSTAGASLASDTPMRIRYSDDGEPAKTAGIPTLNVLQHARLVDVVAVTTRYFGGTLLGTGGLVRAYTQAVQAAIDAATVAEITFCVDIEVQIPYNLYEQALRLAENCNAHVVDSVFQEAVKVTFRMLSGTQGELLHKLDSLMSGNAQPTVSPPFEAIF